MGVTGRVDGSAGRGGGLIVIRSPTGTGAVGGCLNAGCRIATSVKRLHSLPGDRLNISVRGGFRPGCVAVHNGNSLVTGLGGTTGGSTGVFLTASPSHRNRTVS